MKILCIAVVGLLAGISMSGVYADTILSDNFDSYTNGALVGQGGWLQTGATATNPIQVSSGTVLIGSAGGQDVYDPFSSSQTLSSLSSITITLDITVTSAAAGGDYFVHLGTTSGGTSGFYDKLWAKSTTGGYLLGVSGITTTAASIGYGTTVLDLNTTYSISLTWNIVSGASNDTFDLFVNAAPYVSTAFLGTDTEPTSVAEVAFRQGSSTASPGVTVDNLAVTTVAAVPEPGTVAMVALGLGVVVFSIRRRRTMA